jgi:MSHA biogenesis protein MshP
MKQLAKKHRGFSIITAIFLLVVLGTLGTMMVTFFAAQQQSSALDVMGSRAYQASRAGIEWAAYNVSTMPQSSSVAPATLWAAGCTVPPALPFLTVLPALNGTLLPFSVTVSCTATPAVEGATPPPTIYIYDIVSTATYGVAGNPDYVERVLSVKMGR